MKFRLIVVAMVSVALLVTGTAAAFITPPATSFTATGCFNSTPTVQVPSGGYLRFGWGTISYQQALDFQAAQNFTLTATGTNGTPANTTTLASWGTGADRWTDPSQLPIGGRPIYVANAFVQVNLAPGNYTLSTAGTSVNRAVFDGENVTKKGSNWYPITGCLLIVT